MPAAPVPLAAALVVAAPVVAAPVAPVPLAAALDAVTAFVTADEPDRTALGTSFQERIGALLRGSLEPGARAS